MRLKKIQLLNGWHSNFQRLGFKTSNGRQKTNDILSIHCQRTTLTFSKLRLPTARQFGFVRQWWTKKIKKRLGYAESFTIGEQNFIPTARQFLHHKKWQTRKNKNKKTRLRGEFYGRWTRFRSADNLGFPTAHVLTQATVLNCGLWLGFKTKFSTVDKDSLLYNIRQAALCTTLCLCQLGGLV